MSSPNCTEIANDTLVLLQIKMEISICETIIVLYKCKNESNMNEHAFVLYAKFIVLQLLWRENEFPEPFMY